MRTMSMYLNPSESKDRQLYVIPLYWKRNQWRMIKISVVRRIDTEIKVHEHSTARESVYDEAMEVVVMAPSVHGAEYDIAMRMMYPLKEEHVWEETANSAEFSERVQVLGKSIAMMIRRKGYYAKMKAKGEILEVIRDRFGKYLDMDTIQLGGGEHSEQKPPGIYGTTRQKIVQEIGQKPETTAKELAEKLGMSGGGVVDALNRLKRDGLVRHAGPDCGGRWEIIEG